MLLDAVAVAVPALLRRHRRRAISALRRSIHRRSLCQRVCYHSAATMANALVARRYRTFEISPTMPSS